MLTHHFTYHYNIQDLDEEALTAQPNIYCHFAAGVGDPRYMPCTAGGWQDLTKILTEALESYNEINAVMNLVLFEDAIKHV